jgi:hypothetical protein
MQPPASRQAQQADERDVELDRFGHGQPASMIAGQPVCAGRRGFSGRGI